jgi:hypothetical protein
MVCNFKVKYHRPLFVTMVVGDPNQISCLSTNSSILHVFLLWWEHDPCSLYLGAMITGMGIFIGYGYGSHTGIDVIILRTGGWSEGLEV